MVNLSRRDFLKSSALAFLSLSTVNCSLIRNNKLEEAIGVIPSKVKDLELMSGYEYQLVAAFGDHLFADKEFDYQEITNNYLCQSYGYNNDYCAYLPINNSSKNGVICINHEYVQPELIFSEDFIKEQPAMLHKLSLEMLGVSIFEVEKKKGKWQINKNSKYNRRITPTNTKCEISGYAKNSERLYTSSDSKGEFVYGTLANCAGAKTPWGTILTAEENFNLMFGGKNKDKSQDKSFKAYNLKKSGKLGIEKTVKRFDVSVEPNEFNKFGYLVEIDPFDPSKAPVKRTSLGRFFHEGAAVTIAKSGRVVVYSGDDRNFEHLYRFVSKEKYNPKQNNPNILDEGVLEVAKFHADGIMQWIPLEFGKNGLTPENGFKEKSDIFIDTRIAAKQVGATALDRPEGIAINPKTNKVYVALTNNFKRLRENEVSKDNPNIHGYILELDPDTQHDKEEMQWQIILHASKLTQKNGDYIISNPDNLIFDKKGNMWIATDGMEKTRNVSDSIYKFDIAKNLLTRYLNSPLGSEICGPEFTPDNKTLFLNIQHPGSGSDFANPSTRWPKFNAKIPPLPALIAIEKT